MFQTISAISKLSETEESRLEEAENREGKHNLRGT
jgi:hypothetical protein